MPHNATHATGKIVSNVFFDASDPLGESNININSSTYCSTYRNTLQNVTTCCNILQHTATPVTHCNTLRHTTTHNATHATHSPERTVSNVFFDASKSPSERYTATHRKTLQHTLQQTATHNATYSATHCNTCNTLTRKNSFNCLFRRV